MESPLPISASLRSPKAANVGLVCSAASVDAICWQASLASSGESDQSKSRDAQTERSFRLIPFAILASLSCKCAFEPLGYRRAARVIESRPRLVLCAYVPVCFEEIICCLKAPATGMLILLLYLLVAHVISTHPSCSGMPTLPTLPKGTSLGENPPMQECLAPRDFRVTFIIISNRHWARR